VSVNSGDQSNHHELGRAFRHVLLLSIDGLHQIDLANFVKGQPASALAKLARRGVQYTKAFVNRLDGSATNPSDSFPGLLALTTGGSSPTHGGWYDVGYARDLFPYSATAPCSGPAGAPAIYDESIDVDNTFLWGSATDDTPTHEVATARSRIDLTKLPYEKRGALCSAVYPHQFIRTNTIFNVVKKAGLHTAWSDKHLSYELISGPSGDGVDDYFAPDINSDPANSLIPTAAPGGAFTDSTSETEVYDDFKVRAILNEVAGRWSDDRRLTLRRQSHSSAPLRHSYMKPMVRTPRNTTIDQKPSTPTSPNATAHGNRKLTSRSKMMNRIATR